MLDEFGYTTVDFFIFKSTWDFNYHYECVENTNTNSRSVDEVLESIRSGFITNSVIVELDIPTLNITNNITLPGGETSVDYKKYRYEKKLYITRI